MLEPGMLVVCVNDSTGEPGYWVPGEELRKGAIYTVRACAPTIDGDPGIKLEEVRRIGIGDWWPDDLPYWAARFRPICKPSIEVLRRTVKDITEDVDA